MGRVPELPQYSESTREVINSIPLTLLYAEAREEAKRLNLATALIMRHDIDRYGRQSPFARRPGVKRGNPLTPAPNPEGAKAPVRCACLWHPFLPGPMAHGEALETANRKKAQWDAS